MRNVRDRGTVAISGYLIIFALIGGFIYLAQDPNAILRFFLEIEDSPYLPWVIGGTIVFLIVILPSFVIVQPNESVVLTFFGTYVGTLKQSGFFWVLPFTSKTRVSFRVVSLSTKTIKVNDLAGNPIEIGAVVVWHVDDAAKSVLNVDNYRDFVAVQSETAVRALASRFPYDSEDGKVSLRGSPDKISADLQAELAQRLLVAGLVVTEARLSHLAYAPEIASAMLRRQQAQAVVQARRIITENAVMMVENALSQLDEKGLVQLDDSAKVRLVSNLLVALVSERDAQPVLDLNP